MLDRVIPWASIALGLCGILLVLVSMFSTGLLNRRRRDPLAHLVRRSIIAVFASRLRGKPYPEVQRGLGWMFTAFVIALVGTWFALTQAGFTLILWASRAEPDWVEAFISSGSALSTLGFLTPSTVLGRLLAILEGAAGLGIVVFIFTFLPGYQSAIRDREERAAWLYARTGPDGDGARLLAWLWDAHRAHTLGDVWETWEGYFRALAETHSVNPLLSLVPTVYAGQSWVLAALRALDAAALTASTVQSNAAQSARLCVATGAAELQEISAALWPLAPLKLGRQRLEGDLASHDRTAHAAQCDSLTAAGLPLCADREAAFDEYHRLRQSYLPHVIRIAQAALVPADTLRAEIAGRPQPG